MTASPRGSARLALTIFTLAASAPLAAQLPVGVRDVAFANPTGQGSTTLTARVHYPATSAGMTTPIATAPGGLPVLLFLHGFAALGRWHTALGDAFAGRGYVAVLMDTAQFSAPTQVSDGLAWFPALQAANAAGSGSFLEGALDMSRVAVGGHSMGGGSTVNVLAQNPGYAAGFALAPVPAASARDVDVPFVVVHGTGDGIVPSSSGESVFAALTAFTGIKALVLLNDDCDHLNVTGLFLSGSVAQEVWDRTARVLLGLADAFLLGDTAGLEETVGATARAEPRLVRLDVAVEAPQAWLAQAAPPGGTARVEVLGEPGPAALLAAATSGRVPTPYGTLLLDPATLLVVTAGTAAAERRFSVPLPIPAEPALAGLTVPLQGVALGIAATLRLTGGADLRIE
ncbi:MAG: hypothetical protein AAF628_20070 [Planctomycetota bacterium]